MSSDCAQLEIPNLRHNVMNIHVQIGFNLCLKIALEWWPSWIFY